MNHDGAEWDFKGLGALIKALGGDLPKAKVGILGNKNARKETNETNAGVGIKHEFGDPNHNLPVRSFLRVPISEHMNSYVENSGKFDAASLKRVIKDGSIKEWIATLGLIGEQIVFDAFDSSGFGKWKASNMKYKKVHQTLVETQQLRNSIASEVI